jgi:hypothetical protein
MELINASEILYGVSARAGLTRDEVSGDLFKDLRGFMSKRLNEGWRFAKWPDAMRWEERRFLQPYIISNIYHVGDEVQGVEPDPLYYRAKGTVPALNPPPNATYWDVISSEMDAYIPYEQILTSGPFGTVFTVTELNPKTQQDPRAARPLSFWKSENGIQVPKGITGGLASVWVEFRTRSPRLYGDNWDATRAYTGTVQVYFTETPGGPGDFYDLELNTTAGQSPVTDPTKWQLVEIPRFLETWLVGSVYADYLEDDGQTEKSMAEIGQAREWLAQEKFILEAQEGQTERMEASTR